MRNENSFQETRFNISFVKFNECIFAQKHKKTESVKNVMHLAESVRIRKLYFRIGNEVIKFVTKFVLSLYLCPFAP